jgi:MarC family membrane protein
MTIYSATVLLFLVLDPLGNIPFFLTALRSADPAQHRRIILRELLIALAILVVFLFAGRYILDLLSISEPSLSVAGGVVLFLIALKMIFPSPQGLYEVVDGEPFIVPLAVPYVAGPSAIATTLLLMSQAPERWAEWFAALIIAWAVTGIILLASSSLNRVLGKRGLIAAERLMGMILTIVAVEMFLSGLRVFLRSDSA